MDASQSAVYAGALFACSCALAATVPLRWLRCMQPVLCTVLRTDLPRSTPKRGWAIFAHNIRMAHFAVCLGHLTYGGVFPFAVCVGFGALLGVVGRLLYRTFGAQDLVRALPHGVLELGAFCMACGVGAASAPQDDGFAYAETSTVLGLSTFTGFQGLLFVRQATPAHAALACVPLYAYVRGHAALLASRLMHPLMMTATGLYAVASCLEANVRVTARANRPQFRAVQKRRDEHRETWFAVVYPDTRECAFPFAPDAGMRRHRFRGRIEGDE